MKIVAFVGMPGTGKTVATEFLKNAAETLRLGDLTDIELKKRKLEQNEENERLIREELRKEKGMAVYAKWVAEKVEERSAELIVLDGMRSFEEFDYLKKKFGEKLVVISLLASPKTRYDRLQSREYRGLSADECVQRDLSEMKGLDLAKTIVMADCFIVNESTKESFRDELKKVLKELNIYVDIE